MPSSSGEKNLLYMNLPGSLPQRRGKARGCSQEVQEKPEVPVLIVDLVQLSHQRLGLDVLSPFGYGSTLELIWVVPHESAKIVSYFILIVMYYLH